MAVWLTSVLGLSSVLFISLAFFIHYLRSGLDSSSSVKIDQKPKQA